MPFEWQPTLDDVNEVPDKYRGLYEQKDGKFVLDGEVSKRMDVTGLKNGLAAERKTVGELKTSLKGWQEAAGADSPEALREAREREQQALKAAGDPAKHKEHLDKVRADMQAQHAKEIDGVKKENDEMRKSLEEHLVTGTATTAIAAAKGNATLLLPHVARHLVVVKDGSKYVTRVVDADGEPRVGQGPGGFMTVEDFVKELRSNGDFAPAFAASGTTGGGTQPGSTRGGTQASGGAAPTPVQRISAGLQNMNRRQ